MVASEARERLEELRRKQGPLTGQVPSERSAGDDFVGAGLRQFISNALAVPSSIGDVLDAGGAATEAGLGELTDLVGITEGNFGDRFGESFARRQQHGISTLPRPTAEDLGAGLTAGVEGVGNLLQGARPNFAGEFRENLPLQQAVRERELSTGAGQAGAVAGDVATLLTGRAPIAKFKAPGKRIAREALEAKARKPGIPESVRSQTRDVLTDRIFPFFKESGIALKRGIGRVGEASVEGLTLALLNDQDPLSAAMLAGGSQAAGSLGLFLAERPLGRLLPTVATAAVVAQMFKAIGPGDRNIFEAFDFAIDKSIFAIALGLYGAFSGAARLRGPTAERFPALFDAMTAVPRGAVQNRLRELTESENNGDALPLRVMEKLGSSPTFFNKNQLRSLDRALQSGKKGAFTKEVERLREKSKAFQELIDGL